MKSTKVLFIATSHDKMADTTEKTGVGLEELAAQWDPTVRLDIRIRRERVTLEQHK